MYMSKTMKNKRTIYRHPETNKFISKAEWEKLTGMQNVQTVQTTGSDFDKNYIKETKEFMKNIEGDFNKLANESVETIPTQEEGGWKLFFSKLRFWI